MSDPDFKDKFICFLDVLGFKDMVIAAEARTGRTLSEIQEIQAELGREKDLDAIRKYGPTTCPESKYIQQDLDFEITQVSDCAIFSVEISPAGVINLVSTCLNAVIMLLGKGVLVRGYIKRGNIYHDGQKLLGTGYQESYEQERHVSAFKMEGNERGTPFVQLDNVVTSYVNDCTDPCVREMFSRYVKEKDGLTALYPFKLLEHSFIIGGIGASQFDAKKEKENNDNLRKSLQNLKDEIMKHVDRNNNDAIKKTRHYLAAIDEQIKACDKTDEMIERLCLLRQ